MRSFITQFCLSGFLTLKTREDQEKKWRIVRSLIARSFRIDKVLFDLAQFFFLYLKGDTKSSKISASLELERRICRSVRRVFLYYLPKFDRPIWPFLVNIKRTDKLEITSFWSEKEPPQSRKKCLNFRRNDCWFYWKIIKFSQDIYHIF